MKLTGLLIGAGASCEMGMPLAFELSAELKAWLTPNKIRKLNYSWRSQGGGYSDVVIEDLSNLLAHEQMHYESILGYLEAQYRRPSAMRQEYHALYSWLVEIVYYILYLRHIDNVSRIEGKLHYLVGIRKLATENLPFWIFSLNHDLIIECLAAKYTIPVNCGFSNVLVELPRRDQSGAKIGSLRAETITAAQLDTGMYFLQPGSYGINLLKVHGALDVFTFRDGKDLLRFIGFDENSGTKVIDVLRAANEELRYIDSRLTGPVKTTNEITYADEVGQMQFLRRSLLASAFKFDNRQSQVLPRRLLDHFKSNVNHVSTLVSIGYGFGDDHVTKIIRDWLELDADRKLEIVSPGLANIPQSLLHLTPQIVLRDSTATDYLDQTAGIVRDRRDALEKRLRSWLRQRTDKDIGWKELLTAFNHKQQTSTTALFDKIAGLRTNGGAEECVEKWSVESGCAFEDVLEDLLKNVEPVAKAT